MVTSRNAVAFVNIHPQKSKWVTAKIILVSPASILVGEWLQRQRHIGAWQLYILFKCDVRHRLHCFVCTDTHLFNFTKGKTDLVNQRWRRTTCLQHQCYDVGCYPWYPLSGCKTAVCPSDYWFSLCKWLTLHRANCKRSGVKGTYSHCHYGSLSFMSNYVMNIFSWKGSSERSKT